MRQVIHNFKIDSHHCLSTCSSFEHRLCSLLFSMCRIVLVSFSIHIRSIYKLISNKQATRKNSLSLFFLLVSINNMVTRIRYLIVEQRRQPVICCIKLSIQDHRLLLYQRDYRRRQHRRLLLLLIADDK
jgi:hypothetical protein